MGDAIETQRARIEEARGPLGLLPPVRETSLDELETAARITWEAHFLVIAIRQLLRTQEAYFQHTHDERLTEARAPFDRAVPHAVVFRNVLEHLDDYLLDRARCKTRASSRRASNSWAAMSVDPGV